MALHSPFYSIVHEHPLSKHGPRNRCKIRGVIRFSASRRTQGRQRSIVICVVVCSDKVMNWKSENWRAGAHDEGGEG